MMKLLDAVRPECVQANIEAADKGAVLKTIAGTAAQSQVLGGISAEKIMSALQDREDIDSTGFGNGIAIPHCRLAEVPEFVVGLATVENGVDFDAIDGEPVDLVAYIVAPDTQSNAHIRILSQISRVLQIPQAVAEMRAASSAESLRESFLRWALDEPSAEPTSRKMFHVFVQDESMFHDILHVFGSMELASAFVVETENTSAYLAKLPLFAGFWSDNPNRFGRLIVAVVAENMTNETIRRIEEVAGNLAECPGVIVAIQNLYYCDGFTEQ